MLMTTTRQELSLDTREIAKYASIARGGREARQGGVDLKPLEFRGFPTNRFSAILEFSEEAADTLKEKITNPLAGVAEDLGINFIWAGINFPLHCTILEGEYKGQDPQEEAAIYHSLQTNTQLIEIAQRLSAIQTINPQFLLGPDRVGAIILAASPIPELITEARENISTIYTKSGLDPRLMTDIYHLTIGRIVKLPSENPTAKLEELNKLVHDLHNQTFQNPLVLPVSKVFCDPVTTFLQRFPQNLIN